MGTFYRDTRAIYKLEARLSKLRILDLTKPWIKNWDQTIGANIGPKIIRTDVIHLNRVANNEYDRILSSSIILSSYLAASASNVIVECIARNTPLITNRVPPIEEYLGALVHRLVAEGFHSLEGNMCGTAMRGADALPGSKATSRAKGSHRNLGGLGSGRQMLRERDGPHREGEEPKPMMHGHEKSDLVIVAMKPANKARKAPCGGVCGGGRSGVGGAKGGGQGEYAPAQHVLDPEPGSRDKRAGAYTATFAVTHPRWEPYAGKPHVRFCAGGVR